MSSRDGGVPEAEWLGQLVALSRRLATEADLRKVLRSLLESAVALTGAERGFFLFKRKGSVTCEAGLPDAAAVPGPVPPQLSRSVLARVLEAGETVLSTNLPSDERFRARPSVRRLGLRSVLAVPFPARAGATGVLYLDSRVSRTLFRQEDLKLLEAFAAQASQALENAFLAAETASATSGSLESSSPDAAAIASKAPGPPHPGSGPHSRAASDLRMAPSADLSSPERARLALAGSRSSFATSAGSMIVGSSPVMQRVLGLIDRVGPTDLPVLIIGESGTGKELVARAIHASSPRRTGRFVAENCAAIPEPLIESELFGSIRGAYTGAERDREGLFQAADGGTLFLDEIGEMPLPFQARLLRALQEGEVRPVGSPRAVRVNVRVVAATNRDPAAAIASRRLRLDLYYRLAGFTLDIPPLRERREDIAQLADYFMGRAARCRGRAVHLSPEALMRLTAYDWPGNVRELENEIERAIVLACSETIGPEDLSPRLSGSDPAVPRAPQPAERTMIEAALVAAEGNVTEAARAIGWSRQKLYRRMTRLSVSRSYGRWEAGEEDPSGMGR